MHPVIFEIKYMITTKDFCDIIGNKMASEIGKAKIRQSFPPHIAEQLCDAIDRYDKADKFNRIISEYNEWLAEQQRQQQYFQQFLVQYFK